MGTLGAATARARTACDLADLGKCGRGGNVGVWGRVQSSEFIRAYTRQTDQDSPTILFVIEHNICVQLRKVHTTLVGHVTLCVSCGVWGGKLLNS